MYICVHILNMSKAGPTRLWYDKTVHGPEFPSNLIYWSVLIGKYDNNICNKKYKKLKKILIIYK